MPDWAPLFRLKVWKDSIVQVMYSSGVAFGPLMFYGSCKKKGSAVLWPSVLVMMVNALTSILAAVVLFSFLGHVSGRLEVGIADISKGGIDLAFIAYPGMLGLLSEPTLWSILFFVMLTFIGIDSVFATLDAMAYYLRDLSVTMKRLPHWTVCFLMVLAHFLLGIIFTT